MKNPAPLTILCLCVAAALPTAAAAEPVKVEPLGASADAREGGVGAAGGSGCRSKNIIAFAGSDPGPYPVRHRGDIACDAPLQRAECVGRLFRIVAGTPTEISEREDAGQKSCAYDSNFFGAFSEGDEFSERYTFKLTLKRGFVWEKPSGDFCERRNERRQLVCSDSHQTFAPAREADNHS